MRRLLAHLWRRLGLVTGDDVALLQDRIEPLAAEIGELQVTLARLDEAALHLEPVVRIHRGAMPPF